MISFTCNICGTPNTLEEMLWEPPTCSGCRSNVRMRALIYLLSMELFGAARPLSAFPKDTRIKGFGLSDDLLYATPLADKLDYTNTFYDRKPYLDITEPHPELYGSYDFVLSSDVFEHVAPPVERAFEEAFQLLKPGGVMCITVPSSSADDATVEYYPDLHNYSIVDLGGEHVLINRKRDRTLEFHQNLEFHGGIGATLVMRAFAQKDLERKLRAAGFSEVAFQIEPVEQCGIVFEGPWGRPLVARKDKAANPNRAVPAPARVSGPPFAPPRGESPLESEMSRVHNDKAALERRVAALESQLRIVGDSRWLKLGRRLGFGPKLQ
jgi:SAM-dependent methyltransferase